MQIFIFSRIFEFVILAFFKDGWIFLRVWPLLKMCVRFYLHGFTNKIILFGPSNCRSSLGRLREFCAVRFRSGIGRSVASIWLLLLRIWLLLPLGFALVFQTRCSIPNRWFAHAAHDRASALPTRQCFNFLRHALIHLVLFLSRKCLCFSKLQISHTKFCFIDSQQFWAHFFERNFFFEHQLHLLVEVFDALCYA